MIQEFIPGRIKENLYVVVDHEACIRSFMRTEVLRPAAAGPGLGCLVPHLPWILRSSLKRRPSCGKSARGVIHMYRQRSTRGTASQTAGNQPATRHAHLVPDPIWGQRAIALLRLARGESIQTVTDFPRGALVFEPIEDLLDLPFELLDLMLYQIRTGILVQAADRSS